MNKIWLVTELFYPDETSTAYILTKIAQTIHLKTPISVICGPESYSAENRILNSPNNQNFPIYRVSDTNLNKDKFFQRILRAIIISFKLSITLFIKLKKGDKVLIVTNPPLLLVSISLFKLIKRFKLIVIVHDVFPENTIPAGILYEKSFLFKILKKISNSAYYRADKLISLGQDMSTILKQKTKNKVPVSIIPNWADIDNIQPIKRSDVPILAKEYSQKILIQFAGNIGRVQGLNRFLTIIKKVNNNSYHLDIIGNGAEKIKLSDFVTMNQLSQVTFRNSFKRSDQQVLLNECDLALITLEKGMYGLGVPSKFYNILAAAKPILFIGDAGSEVARIIQQYEIGYAYNWDEEERITSFFNKLSIEFIENLHLMGIRARKLAEEFYSEQRILDLYNDAI